MLPSDLTVLFVSYGRAELLDHTLETFFKTNPGCPVSLFDNASAQPVHDVLKKYKFDYKITSDENKGKPFAHNFLAEKCSTPYLLFCDSDIEFLPGWFEKMSDCYQKAETWPIGGLSGYSYGHVFNPHLGVDVNVKRNPPGCALMMSRKVFIDTGPFDESILIRTVDTRYFTELRKKGYYNCQLRESAILHTGDKMRTFTDTGEPIYYD